MYKIAIIDDDIQYVKLITSYLLEQGYTKDNLYPFTSVKACKDTNQSFHLYILDVDMPETSGLQFLEELSQKNTYVIFVSSHDKYIMDAFHINVLSFVRKKDLKSQLIKALHKFDKVCQQQSYLTITSGNRIHTIHFQDILFIESNLGDIIIHTYDQEIKILNKSLSGVFNFLPAYFVYINRNQVMNLKNVRSIQKNSLYLQTNQKLTISRRKVNDVQKAFLKFKMGGVNYDL